MGFEPTTLGTTTRCSRPAELLSPWAGWCNPRAAVRQGLRFSRNGRAANRRHGANARRGHPSPLPSQAATRVTPCPFVPNLLPCARVTRQSRLFAAEPDDAQARICRCHVPSSSRHTLMMPACAWTMLARAWRVCISPEVYGAAPRLQTVFACAIDPIAATKPNRQDGMWDEGMHVRRSEAVWLFARD